jgi:hypothetical protein
MSVVLIILALGIVVFFAVARNQGKRAALRSETVTLDVDEFGVRREMADGRTEGVDWTDITEVEVLTAATGPYRTSGGVVILAGDEEHGCLVPLDRVGDSGLLEGLIRLPGFNVTLFTDALQKRPPTRTVCWRRGS